MSDALEKLQKRIGSSVQKNIPYLMVAQLMAAGWQFDEIWPLMHLEPKTHRPSKSITPLAIKAAEMVMYKEFPWVKDVIQYAREDTTVSANDIFSQRDSEGTKKVEPIEKRSKQLLDVNSKEAIVDALRIQYEAVNDAKQKADILVKIADLQQMKKDEIKEDERHVMHVLPARCNSCPCFKYAKIAYPDIKTLEQ